MCIQYITSFSQWEIILKNFKIMLHLVCYNWMERSRKVDKQVKMLPGKKRRSLPVAVRIVIALAVSAIFCGVGLFLILRSGNATPFPSANVKSGSVGETNVENIPICSATPTPVSETPLPTSIPTPPPTDGRIAISHYSTLQLNDDNADVSALQQQLMDLGYMDADEPGTLYTESTKNAVTLFQRATNADQNGIASASLQETLFSEDAQEYRIKLNDSGADVRSVQRQLSELGYYDDRITGYFGPQTEEAVMRFQSKNGLTADGQITRDEYDLLYSDDAVALATPTPTPTPTPSPTPRASKTPTPKPAKTPTPKPAKTPTPKPTKTPTPKPTRTPKPTPTPKPTKAPTPKPTRTPKPTPTKKPTKTPTPKPTRTPKPTPTPKPTKSPTPKPTKTPKPTPTPKPTKSPTPKPTATPTPKPTKTPKPTPDNTQYEHSVNGLIKCAHNQLGDPYILGDEGPDSFDCSGLVHYCLNKSGIKVGRRNAYTYSNNNDWKRIDSVDELKKGDLLFFKSDTSDKVNHTAIYIGNKQFIHASASKGMVVQSSFSSYWYRNFVCGRRVFN